MLFFYIFYSLSLYECVSAHLSTSQHFMFAFCHFVFFYCCVCNPRFRAIKCLVFYLLTTQKKETEKNDSIFSCGWQLPMHRQCCSCSIHNNWFYHKIERKNTHERKFSIISLWYNDMEEGNVNDKKNGKLLHFTWWVAVIQYFYSRQILNH